MLVDLSKVAIATTEHARTPLANQRGPCMFVRINSLQPKDHLDFSSMCCVNDHRVVDLTQLIPIQDIADDSEPLVFRDDQC